MEETIELEKREIIIGEQLKSILVKDFGKKSISFKYTKNSTGNFDLVMTFANNDSYQRAKSSLSLEFGINISKIEGLKDKYVCIISLMQAVSISGKKVKIYYHQNFNDKISSGHIQEILDKLEYIQPAVGYHPEVTKDQEVEITSNSEKKEQKLKPDPNPETKNPSLEIKKINDKQIVIKDEIKSKFVFGIFLKQMFTFEERMNSPTLRRMIRSFTFEIDGKIHILHCVDKLVFFYLERAVNWYINNNYRILPKVSLGENKIIIDFSLAQKNEKKDRITSGSFCLPPNEGTTVFDMTKRLHRISYLSKSTIKKTGNHFKVGFPSSRGAQGIYSIISEMGWKSKIDDNNLYIFTDSLLPDIKEEEIKNSLVPVEGEEVISTVKTDRDDFDLKIHSENEHHLMGCEFFKFSGSREDGINELISLYEDPELSAFLTVKTKNEIFEVLQADWRRRHPEEYARKLLALLKK